MSSKLILINLISPKPRGGETEIVLTSVGLLSNSFSAENSILVLFEEKSNEYNSQNLKTDSSFSHLHLHTQYSILQASSDINEIANKSLEMKMPAVAITDMYNMFGVFKFLNAILDHPENQTEKGEELKLKPIIGCELSVCRNHKDKENKDYGFQQVFLCKNKNGYHNLSKLSSLGNLDGFYYHV